MKNYGEFARSLERRKITIDGIETAVYFYDAGRERNFLLIHGAGGDFHGMIPLACELKSRANIIFVDLPSHGASELVENISLKIIENWGKNLIPSLMNNGFDVDLIAAHSIGCVAASKTGFPRVWYVNPPLEMGEFAKMSAQLTFNLRNFLKYFYNAYFFALIRGIFLLRNKNRENLARVKWLTRSVETSRENFLQYAEAIKGVANATPPMTIAPAEFVGVVSSRHDVAVKPVSRQNLICDEFVDLDSGHVSVLENSKEIAEAILRSV